MSGLLANAARNETNLVTRLIQLEPGAAQLKGQRL